MSIPRVKLLFSIALILGLVIGTACSSDSDHYQAGLVAAKGGDWETARREFDAAKGYQDAEQQAALAQQTRQP